MKKTVLRLEQALNYWEDFCFGLSVNYQISVARGESPAIGVRGLLVNYQHLRKSMLEVFSADQTKLTEMYVYPKEAYSFSNDSQAMYLPFALLTWSRCSRRVFSISRDLQALLDATSLEGVVWGDLKFPFGSFVVTLEQPLVDAMGVKFDSILIAGMATEREGRKTEEVVFMPLDAALENYRPVSGQAKEHVISLLKKGSLRKAERAGRGLFKEPLHNITTSVFFLDGSFVEKQILETKNLLEARNVNVEKRPDDVDPGPLCESVMRIVAGMCLYLKTLPAKSSLVSNWEKPEPQHTQRGSAITNKAEVCTVSSQFKLSTEEREVFGGKEGEPVKSFGEKCCHFRRGTWCRPPGYGDVPNCPRTIWRRPTLVRADKLKPGELPKGAETILLQ